MFFVLKNLKLNALVRDTSGKPLVFNSDRAATALLKRWGADVRDYQIINSDGKAVPEPEDADEPTLTPFDFSNG